jgi:hypothetical protein
MLLGPLLGGVFEQREYYAVFYMVFGVASLDVLLRLFLIEKRAAVKWESTTAPMVGHFADQNRPKWIAAAEFLIALPFLTLLHLVTHFLRFVCS